MRMRTMLATLTVFTTAVACGGGEDSLLPTQPPDVEAMIVRGTDLTSSVAYYYRQQCSSPATQGVNGDWVFPALTGDGACMTAQVRGRKGDPADGWVSWEICGTSSGRDVSAECDSGAKQWEPTVSPWTQLVAGESTTRSHVTSTCNGGLRTIGYRYLYNARGPRADGSVKGKTTASPSFDVTADGVTGCP